MKFLFSILFSLFLTSISVSAQTTKTVVSGSVTDKEGVPLAGSTVLFLQSDTIAGGAVTNSKGKFEIKGLPAGEYECRVSMIGYDSATRKFTLSDKVKLPKFILEQNETSLNEVTVSAGARSKELAGMSIYYLSERAKKESNAFYALQEIPRLLVNPLDRSIRLDNGTSPLILVNGVKKPLDIILPEMIESVEVIDNPTARYRGDASVSSVLNVKLKKDGLNSYLRGDISARATPNVNFLNSQASFELGTATSSIYVNGGYTQVKSGSESFSDIYQGNLHREIYGKSEGPWRNPYVQLGGDKEFSKKDYMALGVKYIANPTSNKFTKEGQITDTNTGESSPLTSEADTKTKYHELVANLYYKHSFKDTRELEISGDYYYSMNGERTDRIEQSAFYNYTSSIDLDNSRHMGKLDINYSDMLSKSLHLEAGSNTEYSLTNIDDRLDSWPNFRYTRTREYIYAGIDNNRSYNSKFNFSLSLGLDMVFSNADGIRHSYIDVIPSASLRYKFNGKNNLSLQYDRTRSMPNAGQLNPLNTSTDSLNINEGNPLLTPSHTDKVRFGYTLSSNGFRLNPYIQYSYNSDIIQRYAYLEGDIYVSTYQNLGYTSQLQAGASVSYNIPQNKPYYGGVNLSVYYNKDYIKGMPFNGSGVYGSFNGNFGYKRVSAFVYLNFIPSYSYSLYTKSKGTIFSNFQISWRVTDHWNLAVFAEKFLWPKMHSESWSKNNDYYSYSTSKQIKLAPKVGLSVSYTFATKNFKWRNKKQFYNSDGELDSVRTN